LRRLRLVLGAAAVAAALAVLRRLIRRGRDDIEFTPADPERSPLPQLGLGRRVPLVVLPATLLVGGVFALTIALPKMAAAQPPAPPAQPIAFDHRVHAQAAGLDCAFCHRTAATGANAGLPDVQLCMSCHATVGQGQPEIEKVRMAWNRQQTIDWQLVHRLPDHTRFTHDAHIQAGIACSVCHGDVANMQMVTQVRSLKMADCVACHQQNNAPTECDTCHY
jgi:Cytochrome c7 and related cytochrome c/Class III cytochrome C family